jgi:hypothetical protein
MARQRVILEMFEYAQISGPYRKFLLDLPFQCSILSLCD